jgi:hypothetical protein
MPMTPAEAQDLGNLINDLNPYFDRTVGANWEMDIYMGNPAPVIPPAGAPAQIEVEVDSRYPGQWNFGGQPQNINRALRIRYRYLKMSPSGIPYYLEDYLLIGFQGTGAG